MHAVSWLKLIESPRDYYEIITICFNHHCVTFDASNLSRYETHERYGSYGRNERKGMEGMEGMNEKGMEAMACM